MKLFRDTISHIFSILIVALFLSAYRGPEAGKKETYTLDKKESVVTWKGSMQFVPGYAHIGYVYLSQGELMLEDGKLVRGTVEVDMNTIEYKDKWHPNSPIKHLKSPDFFDVEKFPTAAFVITRVVPDGKDMNVTGSLTIKGITHAVTFPINMDVNAGTINANGKLIIDRTKWDIRYGSAKFYDNLADETISDDIELDVKIVARKN